MSEEHDRPTTGRHVLVKFGVFAAGVAVTLAVLALEVDKVTSLGTIVLGVAGGFGMVFLVIYTILARWWESREGWYLWVSSFILAAILAYNFAAVHGLFLAYDPYVRALLRLVIYGGALVIMVFRGVLLILAQFEMRRELKRRVGRDG